MNIALGIFPDKIVRQYNLRALASNEWVYMEIRKVMPDLKQEGRIVNDRLQLHLSKFVYSPVARTPSLWKHAIKNIIILLVVDDFGVKYVGKDNADHLMQALKISALSPSIGTALYLYCDLSIAWYYC